MEKLNLIGALTAVAFFVSAILVFVFRLLGKPQYGHWIGYFEFALAIPLVYLLIKAPACPASIYLLHPDRGNSALAGGGIAARLHPENRFPQHPLDGHHLCGLILCGFRGITGDCLTCRERVVDRIHHSVPDHGGAHICAARRDRNVRV